VFDLADLALPLPLPGPFVCFCQNFVKNTLNNGLRIKARCLLDRFLWRGPPLLLELLLVDVLSSRAFDLHPENLGDFLLEVGLPWIDEARSHQDTGNRLTNTAGNLFKVDLKSGRDLAKRACS
jgi:hypothetical protein